MNFKYKDEKKDVFVNGQKWSNMMEDHKKFLNKIEKLKPYLIELNKNGKIKDKRYLPNYVVGDKDYWPVMVITYNECTFFANDGICKTWIRIRDTFLRPKG